MPDTPRPPLTPGSGPQTLRVRRAPKFSVFLIAGAGLGLLTALILTFAFDGSSAVSDNTGLIYSTGQVFGFLALICVTAGVAVFAILALILDRVSRTRTREVRVDRETVQEPDAG
ncbi:potassium transporter Trk [Microbacterium sp. BK668]|uniref:potassium transporter Trk n=1 Tax=Microbacterium sp. BK668 TaxID=2512118 RepID=UPI00106095CD|nr:potassium transporter Trk [Microbacterium sp. BK668]TDN90895.1 hypothetical protein EV279_0388 [Microbacterium sp. BK668]